MPSKVHQVTRPVYNVTIDCRHFHYATLLGSKRIQNIQKGILKGTQVPRFVFERPGQ